MLIYKGCGRRSVDDHPDWGYPVPGADFVRFHLRLFHQIFFSAGTWMFLYSDTLIRLFPERFGGYLLMVAACPLYSVGWFGSLLAGSWALESLGLSQKGAHHE
jgi:hypothetical protein